MEIQIRGTSLCRKGNPTMGRVENLLQTLDTGIWPDEKEYEPFCKALSKGHVLRSDMQRHYRNLVNQGSMSKLINTKWFSTHSINGSIIPIPGELNFFICKIKPKAYCCNLTNKLTSLLKWSKLMNTIKCKCDTLIYYS